MPYCWMRDCWSQNKKTEDVSSGSVYFSVLFFTILRAFMKQSLLLLSKILTSIPSSARRQWIYIPLWEVGQYHQSPLPAVLCCAVLSSCFLLGSDQVRTTLYSMYVVIHSINYSTCAGWRNEIKIIMCPGWLTPVVTGDNSQCVTNSTEL